MCAFPPGLRTWRSCPARRAFAAAAGFARRSTFPAVVIPGEPPHRTIRIPLMAPSLCTTRTRPAGAWAFSVAWLLDTPCCSFEGRWGLVSGVGGWEGTECSVFCIFERRWGLGLGVGGWEGKEGNAASGRKAGLPVKAQLITNQLFGFVNNIL